jgi:GntR family transcriptional repressor for pyruvate dehydrogenase complex
MTFMSTNIQSVARSPSLVEKVCEQLAGLVRRDLLKDQGWLPTERELSSQLGVSRNVVREATKRLEAQGLVEIQHGKGIQAVDRLHRPLNDSLSLLIPDVADRLRALNEMRLSIEPDAAAYAAERATQGQLRELRRIHEQLESALDMKQAVETDCAFHHAIAEASGNLVFRLVLDSLAELGHASRLRSMNNVGMKPAIRQHAAILKAIEDRNAESAKKLMRSHVLAAIKDIELPILKKKRIR